MASLVPSWMESLLSQPLQHSGLQGLAQQELDLLVISGFVRLTRAAPLKNSKMLLLPGGLLYAHFHKSSHYPMAQVFMLELE